MRWTIKFSNITEFNSHNSTKSTKSRKTRELKGILEYQTMAWVIVNSSSQLIKGCIIHYYPCIIRDKAHRFSIKTNMISNKTILETFSTTCKYITKSNPLIFLAVLTEKKFTTNMVIFNSTQGKTTWEAVLCH